MERRWGLFGDIRGVGFGLRQDAAGEFEVVERLFARHPGR
jgi:hypothetical protein